MSKDKEVSAKEVKDVRDIMVWAIPKEDKAEVESGSPRGSEFIHKEFGKQARSGTVQGNAVNPLFAKMREAKLAFSFKVKA